MDQNFVEQTIHDYKYSGRLTDNFLLLMWEYYQYYYPEDTRFVNRFDYFKNMFFLWARTPVLAVDSNGKPLTAPVPQTYRKGINNTIKYFKSKFEKTNE